MIKKCIAARCDSKYQDKKYGKNMRVHNEGADNKLQCTVCGNRIIGSIYSKR